jgi:hypothetical protein
LISLDLSIKPYQLPGAVGSSSATTTQSRLLSAADLPAGWSATPLHPKDVQASAPCLSALPANPKGFTYADAAFVPQVESFLG